MQSGAGEGNKDVLENEALLLLEEWKTCHRFFLGSNPNLVADV